jgi:asparagine synthase (glutamine-hydrolysing)
LKYSRIVSKHIKSDNNELIIDNEKIFSVFENIHNIYDEPFSDSSQIPSVILAEFANKKVKVALTGDGADELFGGYNRYVYTKELWKVIKFIPFNIRQLIGNLLNKISIKNIFLLTKIFKLLKLNFPQMKDKIEKISNILILCKSEIDMYFLLTQIYNDVKRNIYLDKNDTIKFDNAEINKILINQNLNNQEKMMLIDQCTYLSGDILHKVDRASMNFGLETRLPFLDTDIFEFSRNLPIKNKINGSNGKWILKEISKKYLPTEIIERKKMGFSIPLRKWIEKNIQKIEVNFDKNSERFMDINIDTNVISKYLNEHKNGYKDWSNCIWNLVVLNKWMDKNIS